MQQSGSFWDILSNIIEMHVIHRIEHFRLVDAFDILLLAGVMFYAIKFIVERRAGRLALGLAFIIVASIITTFLDMKSMMLIFDNFTQVGLIALVIMFQPELRAILERLGKISIPNIKNISTDNKNTEYISNAISIITETACDFSMEKTGALIVIERDTKLGDHIKTGTIINAQLSNQLLKNIFYNKAPLHDGAVILRNFRIHSAGCFLPLSLQEGIDESLGTRHRAAIGITEVSDSIVVVVSEETGKISIVKNGTINQNYNYKSLKKELTKLLLPQDTSKLTRRGKNKKHNEVVKEENSWILRLTIKLKTKLKLSM